MICNESTMNVLVGHSILQGIIDHGFGLLDFQTNNNFPFRIEENQTMMMPTDENFNEMGGRPQEIEEFSWDHSVFQRQLQTPITVTVPISVNDNRSQFKRPIFKTSASYEANCSVPSTSSASSTPTVSTKEVRGPEEGPKTMSAKSTSQQQNVLQKYEKDTLKYAKINVDRKKVCTFCLKNREMPEIFMSHSLKDIDGTTICPVLRGIECKFCGASGVFAHTPGYCPLNPRRALETSTAKTIE